MTWGTTARRGTTCLMLMFAGAEVSACCNCNLPPREAIPTGVAEPGDTVVRPILLDSVELDDERYGTAPATLGGRLAAGGHTPYTTRPTPGLPAPLDSMRDSALVAYLSSLRYDNSNRNTDLKYVTCVRGTLPCEAGNDSNAIMFIQPEIGIRHVRYEDVPPNGMIIARVINYGTDAGGTDITIGVPSGRRAWWVVEHVGLGLRARFFIRTHNAYPAVQILSGVPGAVHPYVKCAHPPAPSARPSQAKWGSCATSPIYLTRYRSARVPDASGLASYIHAVSFRREVDASEYVRVDGGWSTCSQVCCAT